MTGGVRVAAEGLPPGLIRLRPQRGVVGCSHSGLFFIY